MQILMLLFFLFVFFACPERCLEPDDKPVEIMTVWEKAGKKKGGEEPIFLFKKKIFLKDDDKEMDDPVARDLVYQQAGAPSYDIYVYPTLWLSLASESFPFFLQYRT